MSADNYDDDRKPGESFATIALHHGQTLDSDHRARAPPIYASTSFAFEDAAHGADVSTPLFFLFSPCIVYPFHCLSLLVFCIFCIS
jgi:O-acetylhomoserine/O-acetylserine sulfhydrylase-like pyridoxal-dependent enzyme